MTSKNIRHLHAHEIAMQGPKVISKPAPLPLCNHSITIYNDLYTLFTKKDWFGLGDLTAFIRSRPLKDLPLNSTELKHPKHLKFLKQGASDWHKFSYLFALEHQTKYCQKGFTDFMYCSFAKYYQPKAFEQLKDFFIQEWKNPCSAIEGNHCSLAPSIDIIGLARSFEADFEGGAFGHIIFHANGSASEG